MIKKSQHIKIICLLALQTVFLLPVTAQLSSGNLSGSAVIGANPTYLYGNLAVKSTGELYLGSHAPRGLQTNTLIQYGNYSGEAGSRLYTSIIDNSNQSGTRGFLEINGTAERVGEGTEIILDMYNNWNGNCIDLVSAHKAGSDAKTFRMTEATYSGHTAHLKVRQNGADLIWYIAEKLITGQQTDAQSLCQNSAIDFEPLIVETVAGVSYQWYRCNADGSGAVNLGAARGAQTAVYTPPTNIRAGAYYYYCVVTSNQCSENSETTDISGAMTLLTAVEITNQPTDQYICNGAGGTTTLSVVATGDVSAYQWYKNGVAVANSNTPDLEVNIVSGELDKYYVEVSGCSGTIVSNTVKVSSAIDILIQKMNTLLLVNDNAATNGGYNFTHYTWYKDGVKIGEGAHDAPNFGGHYYSGDGADLDPYAEYWVEVITTDGKWYRSCAFTPTIKRLGIDVVAYPNPVSKANARMVTVETRGIDEQALQEGTIEVYNSIGILVDKIAVNGRRLTPVQMPYITGVYILKFTSPALQKELKIVVKN